MVFLFLILGCTAAEKPRVDSPQKVEAPPDKELPLKPKPVPYSTHLELLAQKRIAIAASYSEASSPEKKAEVLELARDEVERAMIEEIFPAWYGTSWAFYGTTETPGEGTIACGYFVSTTLRDAGFKVERVNMAKQASEYIILSLAAPETLRRFRHKTTVEVLDVLTNDGVYLIGLDYHVGYLVRDGQSMQMCHSSYVNPSVGVQCEDAYEALAMESKYRVTAPLFQDGMMQDWLLQKPIATRTH
jgi:hypothetical protein